MHPFMGNSNDLSSDEEKSPSHKVTTSSRKSHVEKDRVKKELKERF